MAAILLLMVLLLALLPRAAAAAARRALVAQVALAVAGRMHLQRVMAALRMVYTMSKEMMADEVRLKNMVAPVVVQRQLVAMQVQLPRRVELASQVILPEKRFIMQAAAAAVERR